MIRDLPQRAPELGRLRLGEKETVEGRGGKEVERPKKLDTWRITSPDPRVTDAAAALFGGEVEPWSDEKAGIEGQFQVVTETSAIEVLIPPNPVDTAYEAWGRGGLQRRCDGFDCTKLEKTAPDEMQMVDAPCFCKAKGLIPGNNDDVRKGACDMVLRLRVVIPGMPGLGVFLMTTGSFYAITQIPAQVTLLAGLAERGVLVPADLCVVPHREKKSWEKFAREFFVPELRVRDSMTQLAELAGVAEPAHLARGSVAALPTGRPVEHESSRPSTIADFPRHTQQLVYKCGEVGLTKAEAGVLSSHFSGGRTTSRKDLNLGEAGAFIAVLEDGTYRSLLEHETGQQQLPGEPTADVATEAAPPDDRMPEALRKAWNAFAMLPAHLKAEGHAYIEKHSLPSDWRQLSDEQMTGLCELVDALVSEHEHSEPASAPGAAPAEGETWTATQWKEAAKAAGVRQADLLKEARSFATDLGVEQPKSLDEITDESLASRVRGWLDETRGAA